MFWPKRSARNRPRCAGNGPREFRFLNAERFGTIRAMTPHLSGDCEGRERIRRNNPVKCYGKIPSHISLGGADA